MIKFINSNGNTFDGSYPYVHWIEAQLSIGLWYTLKLMILSDQSTLQTSELPSDSIFRFIDPTYYVPSTVDLDLSTISARQITSTGEAVTISGTTWYVHQILMVCMSEVAGEFTETFEINSTQVVVGADLYPENEILSINLSNRGMELPTSIQKAFPESNIHEANVDYALINRKFKELISNYIDIIDNKGSYESLYNSLKWFEWGDGMKLFEIWQNDGGFFEKELKNILSEEYTNLLFTHRKTTHLSLSIALQQPSDDDIDDERNPVVEDIAYQYALDDLMLKISILGAFFERYFMPIHLDLKRAGVEFLVYTNQIKVLNGSHTNVFNFLEDYRAVDIQMDHTVVLENLTELSKRSLINLRGIAVGKDTMFARRIDSSMHDEQTTYISLDRKSVV